LRRLRKLVLRAATRRYWVQHPPSHHPQSEALMEIGWLEESRRVLSFWMRRKNNREHMVKVLDKTAR
jgi:hypothetical protein